MAKRRPQNAPRLARKLSYLALLTALASAQPSLAQTQLLAKPLTAAVPSQSVARSLTDLAQQAGWVVLIPEGQLQQRASAIAAGNSFAQALEQLLKGTGFSYQLEQGRHLRLVPVGNSSQISDQSAAVDTETTVVYGTALSRYSFDQASSATGFVADIDSLPRTVQVLPEQLALDQNADDLGELLTNAAGVTRAHGFGGTEAQVNIRGFRNSHLFVDGNPVSNRYNIDLADVESTEVVLGPASILHGQVSPGGLINIITKKPQYEQANSLQLGLDEHGQRKLTLDSTGPLNDQWQYRLVLSGEDSDSFRQVQTTAGKTDAERQSFSISPSLSFTPDEYNTFTLSLNYAEQSLPIDRGTVAVADANGNINIAAIPAERQLGSVHDYREGSDARVQFDWDHQFDSGWTHSLKMGYYQKQFDDYQTRPVAGLNSTPALDNILGYVQAGLNRSSVQDNGLLVRISDSNPDVEETDFSLSNSLTGDYQLAGIDNTLYVGANYTRRKVVDGDGAALISTPAPLLGFGFGAFAYDLSVIDIHAPQPVSARKAQTKLSEVDERVEEFGLSIQNQAQVTEKLNLLAGMRYDRFDIDQRSTTYYQAINGGLQGFNQLATPEQQRVKTDNDNISWQAGALYELTDELALYASYSESFTPNYTDVTAGSSSTNQTFDPEDSAQFEIGFKASAMDDRLRFSVSAYELKRENVLKFENLQAHLNGEERTRGVDLTATMQFVPGLNVLASYSYMDSEIIADNGDSQDYEGNRPYSIPQHKARVWGSYEVQTGSYRGLGFGLGAEHVGERYGNDANSFSLPSYTLLDAAAWYYIPMGKDQSLRLQAGIKNLTDKRHFTANGSGDAYRINVGDPRTFYMTARLSF